VLPADLELERWQPERSAPTSIVVLTGAEPRHERFALRLIDSFGDHVIDWYRIAPRGGPHPSPDRMARARRWWRSTVRDRGLAASVSALPARIRSKLEQRRVLRLRALRQTQVERVLFGAEIVELRERVHRRPVTIDDPNDPAFVARVREQSPWLLRSLGGPLLRKPLLEAVRGAAINQHAGWSPDYRGTNTTDWALYHRDLSRVGSTVHLTVSGADAGPVLARSQPCLVADDSPESIFARVVALGTELMIERVRRLLDGEALWIAPQPTDRGRTYLSRELTPSILMRSARDFADDWLAEALERETRW
jgi:methionyl-tRNA formyltransferase